MGHGFYQLSILENRASAHSLHNTARFFQKHRVNYLDYHAFICISAVQVNFLDFRLVFCTSPSTAQRIVAAPSSTLLFIGDFTALTRRQSLPSVYLQFQKIPSSVFSPISPSSSLSDSE